MDMTVCPRLDLGFSPITPAYPRRPFGAAFFIIHYSLSFFVFAHSTQDFAKFFVCPSPGRALPFRLFVGDDGNRPAP
jgi:hypothetical protein